VGKFCFQCNDDEGMLIGTCPHCEECGPIGNMCMDCGDAKFEEEIPEGECPMCGDQGMRGTICSGCEDQSMLYE
jgi:ribosomal protein L32